MIKTKSTNFILIVFSLLAIGVQVQILFTAGSTDIRLALSDLMVPFLSALVFLFLFLDKKLSICFSLMSINFPLLVFLILLLGQYAYGGHLEDFPQIDWPLIKILGLVAVITYMYISFLLIDRILFDYRMPVHVFRRYLFVSVALCSLAIFYFGLELVLIDGVGQKQGGLFVDTSNRLIGLMGNPNAYGFFLVCVFSIVLGQLLSSERHLSKIEYVGALVFLIGILLTGSRGALIALLSVLVFAAIFYSRQLKQLITLVMKAVLILACINVTFLGIYEILLGFSDQTFFSKEDWSSIMRVVRQLKWNYLLDNGVLTASDSGISARILGITAAFSLWVESPVFGVGLGVFQQRAVELGLPVGYVIHNTGLWVLTELGLVGFVILCWMFFAFFKYFWAYRDHPMCLAACLILVASAAMSMTSEILYQRHIWFVLGMAMAVRYRLEKEEARQDDDGLAKV